MRNSLKLCLVLSLSICSCKKENTTTQILQPSILAGRWSLDVDSTVWGTILPAPGFSSYDSLYRKKYIGAPGDYYEFQAGGNLSIHRSQFSTDSASYKLSGTTIVGISLTHIPCLPCTTFDGAGSGSFTIDTLTAHRLVLKGNGTANDGWHWEVLRFNK